MEGSCEELHNNRKIVCKCGQRCNGWEARENVYQEKRAGKRVSGEKGGKTCSS